MKVELISIGDEVLEGMTINTNAAFLSRQLTTRGYEVSRHTVLSDDRALLTHELQAALGRAALVITTGGLGPTLDDVTKEAAAAVMGKKMRFDARLFAALTARYDSKNRSLEQQATVPEGAVLLHNERGTAPGFLLGSLLMLPGPPREMEPMFLQEAAPLLSKHFPLPEPMEVEDLYFFMIREMEIDPFLREIQREHPDAKVGVYPSFNGLWVRLMVAKQPERLALWAARLKAAFQDRLYEGPTLSEAVHQRLIASKKTLALAESCTGGALAARLVAMPDASRYLLGSLVAYSNAWKRQFLHVAPETLAEHGSVSAQAVEEMLRGLLAETEADFALAVSGIAGPTGGTADKPVGTIYIGIAERGGVFDIGRIQARASRSSAIESAIHHALAALWRRLASDTLTFAKQT